MKAREIVSYDESAGNLDRRGIEHDEHGGNMSSGNGFMRDIRDGLRRLENERLDDAYADGFEEAANICVSVLSESIDGLTAKIESGNYLSDQEQFLLSRLNKLKTETQTRCHSRWSRSSKSEFEL